MKKLFEKIPESKMYLASLWPILFLGTFLGGCDKGLLRNYHDPSLQKTKESYQELMVPPPNHFSSRNFPHKKPIKEASLWPSGFEKKMSLVVSEDTPLKDVFASLAGQAQVNLALAPQIKSRAGVTYTARKQPLKLIIHQLCVLSNLRYRFMGETLYIEEDSPYLKTYTVSFLLGTRQNQSRVSVMTDVFSNIQNKGASVDNGSNSLLTSTTTTDFWVELEQNLKLILTAGETRHPPTNSPSSSESKKNPLPTPSPASTPSYSFHKQAGLVSVYGTDHQQRAVAAYLKQLKTLVSSQIIIEAKIVEVTLTDEFKSGINWNFVKGHGRLSAPLGSLGKGTILDPTVLIDKNVFTMALTDRGFSGIAHFMEQFGTVRTLSNPRLTVLNNQPALLKVAKNEVFFRLDVERLIAADGKPDVENTTSQIQTIPIGLVMTVQPSVNLETEEIILTLRPTISRVVERRDDPAVAIKSDNQVESSIPVVQVREMDSVLKIKSGEVVVMGGLMEDNVSNASSSVPGVSEIPLLGNFFKATEDSRNTTELVIFLRATLVHQDQDDSITAADQRLYESFTQDPRPLF